MTQSRRFFPDQRFRVQAGRLMGVLSILLGLYALIVVPVVGLGELLLQDFIVHSVLTAVGFGLFAFLAVPRQPFNNSVWVAVWAGLISGVSIASYSSSFVVAVLSGHPADLDVVKDLSPADLPAAAGILYGFVGPTLLSFMLIVGVGLVLFPDGRVLAPGWRGVIWGSLVVSIVFAIAIAHEFRPSSTTGLGAGSDRWTGGGRYVDELAVAAIVFAGAGLVSAVIRFRASSGTTRQQFKWMALGSGLFVTSLLLTATMPGGFVADVGEGVLQRGSVLAGIASILISYAIAVGKYRLYDIDVVISRTLVYGSLLVFITAVYVGTVVGLSTLFNIGEDANTWLGIGATVVIAIAFQPLRLRLQRLANRMVYGRRASHYEVLSAFSQQMAAVDPGVLSQVARMLTEGTTAMAAAIWIVRKQRLHRIAIFPAAPSILDVELNTAVPGGDQIAEVTHDGDLLGMVVLELAAGQPFPPADSALLRQVAAGLGLALRNLQLTDDLRMRVDQLRESRRRVVAVQDQTRQMLERDLHDGAQQRLVALKIKVGLGAAVAQKRDLADVQEILETVRAETDLTIDSLRNLARGIYPPLLESEGLAAALTAQLRRAPLPVTVQGAGVGRQAREVEATVYFCVLEAVQNAIKHAQAGSVLVTLAEDDGYLAFDVRDDGIGLDEVKLTHGVGLQNMADRLDALGGVLEVSGSSGHGTKITGRIPISRLAGV